MKRSEPWRIAIAALLISSGVLFLIGTRLERSSETAGHTVSDVSSTEAGESAEHRAAEGVGTDSNGESLLGLNPDSTPAVAAAVFGSLLLALAIFFWRSRAVIAAVGLLGLVFAGLDLREVFHQVDISHLGLVVIAAILTVMHLGVSGFAAFGFRAKPRTS
ncbi:MAG: hypothetical protein LC723_05265 [Actinobacteria bacterium]|nr:hypothetical protein [Actinomycetota bacterium]